MGERYIGDKNKRNRNASSYRSSRVQSNPKVIDIKTIRRKKRIAQKGSNRPNRGIVNIIANAFSARDAVFYKRIGIIAGAIIAAVLIIWGIYAVATNKNAYEVFIENKSVGFVEKNKNITIETLTETVTAQLTADAGANIQVLEKLTLVPAHAAKKEIKTVENTLTTIRKSLSYKIEAMAVLVNGEQVAILQNHEETDEVFQKIMSQFVPEGKNIVHKDFVENVTQKSIFVDPTDIITADKAYTLLTQTADSENMYTVSQGDSLWIIANNAGMSVDELLSINPHLSVDSVLKIGAEIKLVLPKSFLSVITKEETTRLETVKKPVVYQDNPEKKKNYQKSIQQGKDGQKEIVEYIVRVNGFETGIEPVSEKTIIEPITEIIERGTQ